jgi:hypothetical protein
MRELMVRAGLVVAVLAGLPGWGQMHKVAKPQQVVRAVGVYEWTGDMAKPTASRLIPVSLFLGGTLQDAGVYLARPVPFALDSGNVYELQEAGVARGTLELVYARHLQAVDRTTGDSAYDDGWFGYGSFHGVEAEKKKGPVLQASKTLSVIATGKEDADRPTFKRPGDSASGQTTASAGTGSAPVDDPNRPTMKRAPDSAGDKAGGGASAGAGSNGASADDPDRPTTKRAPDSAGASTPSSGGSGGAPEDDPDRPTLKRRSPEDAKRAAQAANAEASVSGVGSLNDDPNRPKLHYGKPAGVVTGTDLPQLKGLPKDLHQMVAVSDAVTREPHDFARAWEDAAERAAVLAKMEALAREKLAAYGVPAPVAAAPAAPAVKGRRTTSKLRRAVPRTAAPVAAPVALMDEVLKGYTLSYGGDPTYVLMAHTAGTGAALRYVTVVAQTDSMGGMKAAIESVTDAAHLDRTPRMRLVDVVDAEASNRASLLFELRWQSSRQFALYRVIAAKADQTFVSGTTQ